MINSTEIANWIVKQSDCWNKEDNKFDIIKLQTKFGRFFPWFAKLDIKQKQRMQKQVKEEALIVQKTIRNTPNFWDENQV